MARRDLLVWLAHAPTPTPQDFSLPTLALLREMHTPCSRFSAYVRAMPPPEHQLNGCNLPLSYVPLLQSSYWVRGVAWVCASVIGRDPRAFCERVST